MTLLRKNVKINGQGCLVGNLELWGHAEIKATKYKPRYLVGFSSGFFWGFWLSVYFPPGLLVWSLFKGLSLFHLSFWKHRRRSLILVSSHGKHTFQSVVSGPAAAASIWELINNAHSEVPSRPIGSGALGVPDVMWCVLSLPWILRQDPWELKENSALWRSYVRATVCVLRWA